MAERFEMLENNPEVMNHLAYSLGLDKSLSFYDVYSLDDPELLAFIPRPALALLVIIPLTPSWHAARTAEDADKPDYAGKGEEEPVIWFKQLETIGHACGSIGLTHALLNSEASKHIQPGSTLDQVRKDALPKAMMERAKVLEHSDAFVKAHADAAKLGDTVAPAFEVETGQHFVAFVKGRDGHLWELEGSRKGPLDRGALNEDEDVLSPAALEKGLGNLIRIEAASGGDLRFSAIALAENLD
ncbi:cysteine proteinase [Karstenula rhodostoma CBS 690.94]|uniref:Ubiquitin carboxyl-terminal hydrolase n=1 Tax=Karstenula rhodostoma CBS 690.94 TaxID=1392251 RepID=A0A9P4PCZ7_9PLEO|nr:cysteine proteinase [Karstenula rhodostoma CBS 690.94]